MKNDAGNCAALRIIGNHLLQAAAHGDSAAVEGHALVYQAIVKAAKGHIHGVQSCL